MTGQARDTGVATPARRGRLVVVTILTVIAALLGGFIWMTPDDDEQLRPTNPTTTYVGPAITRAEPEFHQSFYLEHPGKEIRIVEVEALTSPNVEQIGAVTVWGRDLTDVNVGGGAGFPPSGIRGTHPIEQVVPASETAYVPRDIGFSGPAALAVAVGFRLNGGGIGAVNGVQITYKADGERIRETFRVAVIACLAPMNCEGPRGSDDPDFEDRVLRQFGLLPKE